jgi:hypothetical protein
MCCAKCRQVLWLASRKIHKFNGIEAKMPMISQNKEKQETGYWPILECFFRDFVFKANSLKGYVTN